LPVLLAAVPASATVTPLSASNVHSGGAQKLEMGFFEQWGIYGRGFTLASADHEGEIADLTDLDYAFGGVEPLAAATHNSAGLLAVSNQPIQPVPAKPNYNPVVCSSLDTWADYQDPYLTDVDDGSGVAASGLAGNFQQLAELKAKYPDLKVIMSLGGYNGSAFFSAAAATPASPSLRFVVYQHVHKGQRPGFKRPPGHRLGAIDPSGGGRSGHF
jgi:chitinase